MCVCASSVADPDSGVAVGSGSGSKLVLKSFWSQFFSIVYWGRVLGHIVSSVGIGSRYADYGFDACQP